MSLKKRRMIEALVRGSVSFLKGTVMFIVVMLLSPVIFVCFLMDLGGCPELFDRMMNLVDGFFTER